MSLRLIGANPGITLFADPADDASERLAFASVWRVDWSPHGRGHALVLWHDGRTRVVTPSAALGEWLAADFTRHFPEVEGLPWPAPEITVAPVDWDLDLAQGLHAGAADVTVTITGPMDHRLITVDTFDLGGAVHQLSTVYVPCRTGVITVAGQPLPGHPRVVTEPRASSSAFLADAEIWSRATVATEPTGA